MSWRFVILPVSFLCTSHLPSQSSPTLPISDPVCALMTPKLSSPHLQPLSWVPGTYVWLTHQKMHVSKWLFLPNYFPPVVSTLVSWCHHHLLPLPNQAPGWHYSFCLFLSLLDHNSLMCEWVLGNTDFVLSSPKCPVPETIHTHSRHFIPSCWPHGTQQAFHIFCCPHEWHSMRSHRWLLNEREMCFFKTNSQETKRTLKSSLFLRSF